MEEALATIHSQALVPVSKIIPVELARVGHVLAEPIYARWNVPSVRTSIKDGYAVIGAPS